MSAQISPGGVESLRGRVGVSRMAAPWVFHLGLGMPPQGPDGHHAQRLLAQRGPALQGSLAQSSARPAQVHQRGISMVRAFHFEACLPGHHRRRLVRRAPGGAHSRGVLRAWRLQPAISAGRPPIAPRKLAARDEVSLALWGFLSGTLRGQSPDASPSRAGGTVNRRWATGEDPMPPRPGGILRRWLGRKHGLDVAGWLSLLLGRRARLRETLGRHGV